MGLFLKGIVNPKGLKTKIVPRINYIWYGASAFGNTVYKSADHGLYYASDSNDLLFAGISNSTATVGRMRF